MRKTAIALAMVFCLAVATLPAVAQEGAGTDGQNSMQQAPTELTAFNRDLVSKIKRGCIYIWAMSPENPWVPGYQMPLWIGSGVIFMAVPEEDAAYALTNHHVAQGTTLLQCETWDRSTYKAQFVATEPGIDAALIRIENIPRDKYEPCVLGNSDNVIIGELALAVGAPGIQSGTPTNRSDPWIDFGLHQTATMRVVTGRSTDPYEFVSSWSWWKGPPNYLGHEVMTDCPWRFVVEASISGGNSGGPLFNSRGECIGLNHAGFAGDPGIAQHENFSIPINFAKDFAFQILDTGKYDVPWFGMDLIIPKNFDNPYAVNEFVERFMDPTQLRIMGVRADCPASRAVQVDDPYAEPGLRAGDQILTFDGRTFADITALRLYVFTLPIGKAVPLTVRRGRHQVDFEMVVEPKRGYDSEFSL